MTIFKIASMGPRLGHRGDSSWPVRQQYSATLQWGRGCDTAEIWPYYIKRMRDNGFNGAAVVTPRRSNS